MDPKPEQFDKKYANRAMLLFAGFAIVVLYIETMLIPSLPSIALQYHVDAAQVSLVVSLYLVSGVALSPIVGKLGDIYGKKKVLSYIIVIYVASVATTGFSPNFTFLLVSRTIQGIGLTIFALLISLVQEEFPKEMVPRALAIIIAMFGVGSAVGLPLGSFVSNYFGWQASYHTALPFVLIFAVLIILQIKESRFMRPETKVDYLGAAGLAAFLAMLVFALSEGGSFGFTSPLILGLLAGSLISAVLVVWYERKVKEPILNFKLLGIKNVMSANMITLIAGFSMFFSYQAFAYLFESPAPLGFGFNIFDTGLALVPFAAAGIIVAPTLGKLIPKYGVKPFFLIGAFVGIMGFVISSFVASETMALIGEAVVGIGVSILNVPTINLLVLSIDRREMGLATSLNSVFRFFGSAVGPPLAGVIIAVVATNAAFQYSFYLAIVGLVVAAVMSLRADEILGNKAKAGIEQEVSI